MKKALEWLNQPDRFLFTDAAKINAWLRRVWLAGLLVFGALVWGYLFNWGRIDFSFHDWGDITAPRLVVLKDAVERGELPLHVTAPNVLNFFDDRFMSVPDMLLSPQVILLRWLTYNQFVMVDVLLLYALGYWGLVKLGQRLHLSLTAFTALFLLFNFNGQMLAHLGVGHLTWSGCFLLSWYALLVVDLLERPERGFRLWRWVTGMALVMFAMYLQGSFHQFIYCLIFLGLLALSGRKFFIPALAAAFSAILLSAVRILPPVASLGSIENAYFGGFADLTDIVRSLLIIQTPEMTVPFTELGGWETTFYVGLIGGGFLLYFGVVRWFKQGSAERVDLPLLFPVAVMTLLSQGWLFGELRSLIPLLSSERVSSRLFSLPFVFLTVISVREFQRWLETDGPRRGMAQMLLLVAGVGWLVDMGRALKVWSVQNAMGAFPVEEGLSLAIDIGNHADPVYLNDLTLGAVISVAALVGLLVLAGLEGRRLRRMGAVEGGKA